MKGKVVWDPYWIARYGNPRPFEIIDIDKEEARELVKKFDKAYEELVKLRRKFCPEQSQSQGSSENTT